MPVQGSEQLFRELLFFPEAIDGYAGPARALAALEAERLLRAGIELADEGVAESGAVMNIGRGVRAPRQDRSPSN